MSSLLFPELFPMHFVNFPFFENKFLNVLFVQLFNFSVLSGRRWTRPTDIKIPAEKEFAIPISLIFVLKNENLIGIKAKVTEIIKREIKVRILYNPIDFT